MPRFNRIHHYIKEQLLISFLITCLSTGLLVWLAQSLRFIDWIISRGISIDLFFKLTLLLIPSLALVVIPFSVLLAVLFTYNRLIQDSELTVMSTQGLAPIQLARPATVLSLYGGVAMFAISAFILPASYQQFKDLQYEIRSQHATAIIKEGDFVEVADFVTVYVEKRNKQGWLERILVNDERDPEQHITLSARLGQLDITPQIPVIYLVDGMRQQYNPETGSVSWLAFDSYSAQLPLFEKSAPPTRQRSDEKELFLHELLLASPNKWGADKAQKLQISGHSRLLMPLLPLAMVLATLSIILPKAHARRYPWKRILSGFTAGLIVQILFIAVQYGAPSMQIFGHFMLYLYLASVCLMSFWALTKGGYKQCLSA